MSPSERLYIALYARGSPATMPGGEDKYHWAFILGPKSEGSSSRGTRYHAKEQMEVVDGQLRSVWQFEEREIGMAPTAMVLVRVLIGKVKKKDRLEAVMRSTPIRAQLSGWNCVYWIGEALQSLHQYQVAGSQIFEKSAYQLEWGTICQYAIWYVEAKVAVHRFDGQATPGAFDNTKVPTWDLLKNVELTP